MLRLDFFLFYAWCNLYIVALVSPPLRCKKSKGEIIPIYTYILVVHIPSLAALSSQTGLLFSLDDSRQSLHTRTLTCAVIQPHVAHSLPLLKVSTSYIDYYSFADPGWMEGWVGVVGWPIADSLPTKWSPVNRRSDAGGESPPDKDRRPNRWSIRCQQCSSLVTRVEKPEFRQIDMSVNAPRWLCRLQHFWYKTGMEAVNRKIM